MPPGGLVPPHFRARDGLLTQYDHRCMQRANWPQNGLDHPASGYGQKVGQGKALT